MCCLDEMELSENCICLKVNAIIAKIMAFIYY